MKKFGKKQIGFIIGLAGFIIISLFVWLVGIDTFAIDIVK